MIYSLYVLQKYRSHRLLQILVAIYCDEVLDKFEVPDYCSTISYPRTVLTVELMVAVLGIAPRGV